MNHIEPILFRLKCALREALRNGELLRQQRLLNQCDKLVGEERTKTIQRELESERN